MNRVVRLVNCLDTKLEAANRFSLSLKRKFDGQNVGGCNKKARISPRELEQLVWHEIGEAFAMPLRIEDDLRCYLPTQVLAEVIQSTGADGLIHFSSLGDGENVVLFDPNLARVIASHVTRIRKLVVVLDDDGPFY